jgi:hypothetical protein
MAMHYWHGNAKRHGVELTRGFTPDRLHCLVELTDRSMFGATKRGGGAVMETLMEMRTFGRTRMRLSILGCGAVGGLMFRGDPLDQERAIAQANKDICSINSDCYFLRLIWCVL